jgi:hypothetical protein
VVGKNGAGQEYVGCFDEGKGIVFAGMRRKESTFYGRDEGKGSIF